MGDRKVYEFITYTEWATKKYPAFRFERVFATVLISVFKLTQK